MIIKTHQKFYLVLLRINNLVNTLTMMNRVNNEFSHIEVWFIDQFIKLLEIEDYVNLTLIIG